MELRDVLCQGWNPWDVAKAFSAHIRPHATRHCCGRERTPCGSALCPTSVPVSGAYPIIARASPIPPGWVVAGVSRKRTLLPCGETSVVTHSTSQPPAVSPHDRTFMMRVAPVGVHSDSRQFPKACALEAAEFSRAATSLGRTSAAFVRSSPVFCSPYLQGYVDMTNAAVPPIATGRARLHHSGRVACLLRACHSAGKPRRSARHL